MASERCRDRHRTFAPVHKEADFTICVPTGSRRPIRRHYPLLPRGLHYGFISLASVLITMSKHRFFYPSALQAHQHIELPDSIAHYALRVLRLKSGTEIVLFNGHGGEYPARLDCQGKRATAITGTHNPREAELAGHINLIQGLASADKMDWIIEKAAELGAHQLVPIAAQRSVLQLRGDRLEKRLHHWQRVAQSASEQCSRNRVMMVNSVQTLKEFLSRAVPGPNEITLLCHPEYGTPLNQAISNASNTLKSNSPSHKPVINLIVGPEGGWSEAELNLAEQHGITPIRFGPRVLRTETAGLAMIAASTALLDWGDMQDGA